MFKREDQKMKTTQDHPRRSFIPTLTAAVCLAVSGQAVALATHGPANRGPSNASANAALKDAANWNGSAPSAAASVERPEPTDPNKGRADILVSDAQVVDLHVNDEELANVLEMLSIQSQRNIVASKNVSARITANLYGVTFTEALDAILHVNGYGYIEKGSFIYVYTLEELKTIEAAQRARVWKTIKLNYLNAIDAAEFAKPVLSEGGQIKTNGKTSAFSLSNGPTGQDDFANEATLVIYDFEENVVEIEKLVRQIDTKPAQVLVEATILQTELNEANALGVDFSIISDMSFNDFALGGGPLKVVDSLIAGKVTSSSSSSGSTGGGGLAVPGDGNGKAITSTAGGTSGPGTFKVGIATKDVSVFLKMLDEITDTTILSNPKILALNRQPARVLVGRKVGYLNTTSTDTATTQTVQFLDTGTQLNFRPFITTDGMIRMELKPQVSEAVIRDTKDSTGNSVTIPDEITNELTTNVIVRDGQTIVLGGLFRESTQVTRRQVPWLGDIPILGNAFRGKEDATKRTEIIFLITPTILTDSGMADAGSRGRDYVEKVRTGSREGLLPWSRDKMTAKENVEAEKLLAEGKTDAALSKITRSLRKNPLQPDAIKIREQITGEPGNWPSRSMLEDIVSGESRNKAGKPSSAAPLQTAPVASTSGTNQIQSAAVESTTAIANPQIAEFQNQAAQAAAIQTQNQSQAQNWTNQSHGAQPVVELPGSSHAVASVQVNPTAQSVATLPSATNTQVATNFVPIVVVGPSFEQLNSVDPADYVFSTLQNPEFTFNSFAAGTWNFFQAFTPTPIPVQSPSLTAVPAEGTPVETK
jgi:type IV pilus assembly protein PilQ